MLVEVLTASGCDRCQQAKTVAKEVIAELGDTDIQYCEINVLDDIDSAVKLGVLSPPAIAINGELVFSATPSSNKLLQAILERLGSR